MLLDRGRFNITPRRGLVWALIITWVSATMGCATTPVEREKRQGNPHDQYTTEGRRIAADPVGYLRELKDRCDRLAQYRLTFYRQERLGIIPSLGNMEEIRAAFRQSPFSVKFNWDDDSMPFFESVYVKGQNNDKMLIRERKGLFPFPPQVRILDVQAPVVFGKAKNPITAFGLSQLASRTLAPFDDPQLAGIMRISYEGLKPIEPTQRLAHHFRIERPPTTGYRYTRQDFYVDAETQLPSGTDLYLKTGELDARYRYADIETDVTLTDEDFRLDEDHPETN